MNDREFRRSLMWACAVFFYALSAVFAILGGLPG